MKTHITIPSTHTCISYILIFFGATFANTGLSNDYTVKVSILGFERPTNTEIQYTISNANTNEEAKGLLQKFFSNIRNPKLSDISVNLNGPSLKNKITKKTNKKGEVVFTGIPFDTYELTAETTVLINDEPVIAKARAFTRGRNRTTFLTLSPHWVTLKGKVIDSDGAPVANTHISLRPLFTGQDSGEQYNRYPLQNAISNADGTYEMSYVKALNAELVAFFLTNVNSALNKPKFFYGLIYAKESPVGKIISKKIKIPLISENIAKQARSYISAINKKRTKQKQSIIFKEQENIVLPKSKGDIIFLPDIILENDKTKKPHP